MSPSFTIYCIEKSCAIHIFITIDLWPRDVTRNLRNHLLPDWGVFKEILVQILKYSVKNEGRLESRQPSWNILIIKYTEIWILIHSTYVQSLMTQGVVDRKLSISVLTQKRKPIQVTMKILSFSMCLHQHILLHLCF